MNNEQREIIYAERRRVLNGENMRDVVFNMMMDTVDSCVDRTIMSGSNAEEWDIRALNELLIPIVPMDPVELTDEEKASGDVKKLKQRLKEITAKLYEEKESEFQQEEQIRELERVILLKVIDRKWMDHIDDMSQLRQSIGLQAYGQKDPVIEYKYAGYDMFQEMTNAIKQDTTRLLLHVRVEQKIEREQVAKATGTNKDDTVAKGPIRRKEAKIGRNDPCPCGSGLKYKQCCGRGK